MHLRAQIACHELKKRFEPKVMFKKIFHGSLKNSKFTRICMEKDSCDCMGGKNCFTVQILLNFGGCRYF